MSDAVQTTTLAEQQKKDELQRLTAAHLGRLRTLMIVTLLAYACAVAYQFTAQERGAYLPYVFGIAVVSAACGVALVMKHKKACRAVEEKYSGV